MLLTMTTAFKCTQKLYKTQTMPSTPSQERRDRTREVRKTKLENFTKRVQRMDTEDDHVKKMDTTEDDYDPPKKT